MSAEAITDEEYAEIEGLASKIRDFAFAAVSEGETISKAEIALIVLACQLVAQNAQEMVDGFEEMVSGAAQFRDSLNLTTPPNQRKAREMDWKPIESAPKDGTPILAYCPETAKRDDWSGAPSDAIAVMAWCNPYAPLDCPEKWVSTAYDVVEYSPTHWMPLPEPPQ